MTEADHSASSLSVLANSMTSRSSNSHEPRWWSWADIVRHSDRLGVPNFQRGAVWDSGNRTALLESIYEQSPCGTFVLWAPHDTTNPFRQGVPLCSFAPHMTPMWLVDGQQRTRAMLDTFWELTDPMEGPVCRELVREVDRSDLLTVKEMRRSPAGDDVHQHAGADHDARLWFVALPAMTVFDKGRELPFFGQHSESRNVRRGSMFRRLQPKARLRRGDDGKTRPIPPLPVGLVPLATLLSKKGVFHDARLREEAASALARFGTDALQAFSVLDDLLPWGPQFVTGYAYEALDGDKEPAEAIRWKALHARRKENAVRELVKRLHDLFAPEWAMVFDRFNEMLTGNRFAVGWLPSGDASAAIDAYVRINRAGVRVREEERALALLSRAWPQLLDELAAFIRLRDGSADVSHDQRALLTHESDRQMGFGFWMTTVTRYAALALLGSSARRWLGSSALAKDTFAYRLDRVGPHETQVGRKVWARDYVSPGELIRECAERATLALVLVDAVLSESLFLDHRMARPSARALQPMVDLLYRVPAKHLASLRTNTGFRAAVGRLLHWTLLAPYIDQPDLERLVVEVHGIDVDGVPVTCWVGDSGDIDQALQQSLRRYQLELLRLWRDRQAAPAPLLEGQSVQSQLALLAGRAFESEVGIARSLQHPAVGWLYALERRGCAREFSWKAQADAFRESGGKVGVQSGTFVEELLRRSTRDDLYPEKQHIVPFSIARQIVDKGGTRATASPANDIGNLTWLSHRQNGIEALGDRWTAMDRDLDASNLAARGMSARAVVDGPEWEVLKIYQDLQAVAPNKEPWGDKAHALFAALCRGRRDWMVKQMCAWLEQPLPAEALKWLGDDAREGLGCLPGASIALTRRGRQAAEQRLPHTHVRAQEEDEMPSDPLDWFQRITGFKEAGYADTLRQLVVKQGQLIRLADGRVLGSVGRFETPTLADLRDRASTDQGRRTTVRCIVGDVRALHRQGEFADALFQVASQFNCLEMIGPEVTPEAGVTRYNRDPTQGPACAIAAGLGTIYRNYFAPVGDQSGQTAERQIDNLADVGQRLADLMGHRGSSLWTMSNGYCEASADQLQAINATLARASAEEFDTLRAGLRIGLHHDLEVTEVVDAPRPKVTQAYCSAVPVGYSRQPASAWQRIARLVLEASYEAALLAAAERAAAGRSPIVLLTRIGGGVFHNEDAWITDAVMRALRIVEYANLDVRLVSFGRLNPETTRIERAW